MWTRYNLSIANMSSDPVKDKGHGRPARGASPKFAFDGIFQGAWASRPCVALILPRGSSPNGRDARSPCGLQLSQIRPPARVGTQRHKRAGRPFSLK
jgi:hypothetical protein